MPGDRCPRILLYGKPGGELIKTIYKISYFLLINYY